MEDRILFNDSITVLDPGNPLFNGMAIETASQEDLAQPIQVCFEFPLPPGLLDKLTAIRDRRDPQLLAELDVLHAFNKTDTDALSAWLTTQGYTIDQVSTNGTIVFATATASRIAESLQVEIVRVMQHGIAYVSANTQPSLPAAIGKNITAIMGLQTFHVAQKHSIFSGGSGGFGGVSGTASGSGHPTPGIVGAFGMPAAGFSVDQIMDAYNGNVLSVDGSGQLIAIVIDQICLEADLASFWNANNLSIKPGRVTYFDCITKLPYSPPQTPVPTDFEASLDVQWSSGIAAGAEIIVFTAPNLQWPNFLAVLDVLYDQARLPYPFKQVSISLGFRESIMSPAALNSGQKCFQQLTSLGVNVFAASGDSGYYYMVAPPPPSTAPPVYYPRETAYPATDPNVIAVGGTTLHYSGSSRIEDGWSLTPLIKWGSGGGFSSVIPRPAWQKGSGVTENMLTLSLSIPGFTTPTFPANRQIPDVSMAADPFYGGTIFFNGVSLKVGGTSWAAPMWAGLCAIINEARAQLNYPGLPYLNRMLYPLIGEPCFRDITTGNNGYQAGPGYDLVTGIGVPVINLLVAALMPYQRVSVNTKTAFPYQSDGQWFMGYYRRASAKPDLIFLQTANTASGHVEISVASGASNYQTMTVSALSTGFSVSQTGIWLMADYYGTGALDLILITESPLYQVDLIIASASSDYQTLSMFVGTSFNWEPAWAWRLIHYDSPNSLGTKDPPDLYGINYSDTSVNPIVFNYLLESTSYTHGALNVSTGQPLLTTGSVQMVYKSGALHPDMVYISYGTNPGGKLSLSCYSSATNYHTETKIVTGLDDQTDGTWLLFDSDEGYPHTDLAFIKTSNCASGMVEIQIASGM